jgi:hypothetical protein
MTQTGLFTNGSGMQQRNYRGYEPSCRNVFEARRGGPSPRRKLPRRLTPLVPSSGRDDWYRRKLVRRTRGAGRSVIWTTDGRPGTVGYHPGKAVR